MQPSPAILALTTLSFCASIAMIIGAYKAHNVLKDQRSIAFLTSFSLIGIGLLLHMLASTQFAHELSTALAAQLGLTSGVLIVLSGLALLSAYTLLLLVTKRLTDTTTRILAGTLVVTATVLAAMQPVALHAVTIIVLALLARAYYKNFLAKDSTNALIVYGAFLALTIGHTAALLGPVSHAATITFLGLRLLAYFGLFAMLWRVSNG